MTCDDNRGRVHCLTGGECDHGDCSGVRSDQHRGFDHAASLMMETMAARATDRPAQAAAMSEEWSTGVS